MGKDYKSPRFQGSHPHHPNPPREKGQDMREQLYQTLHFTFKKEEKYIRVTRLQFYAQQEPKLLAVS